MSHRVRPDGRGKDLHDAGSRRSQTARSRGDGRAPRWTTPSSRASSPAACSASSASKARTRRLDVNAGDAETALTPARGPRSEVEFTVKCSYLEIYNETVADLLAEPGSASQPNTRSHDKKGVFVEGLIEASVTSAEDLHDLFTRGSIQQTRGDDGDEPRVERAHAVFTLSHESRRRPYPRRAAEVRRCSIGGPRRIGAPEIHRVRAGCRLKEASAINKSLSALGNVIKALVDVADGKDRHARTEILSSRFCSRRRSADARDAPCSRACLLRRGTARGDVVDARSSRSARNSSR